MSFRDLTHSELELFSSNLIDGRLQVTRTFLRGNPKESGNFSVQALANPEFSECRNESGRTAKREIYKSLREQTEYLDLPQVSNADQIDPALEQWEATHPEQVKLIRVGSFRGFKNVAIGQLKRKTDFVFVPAVREAATETGDTKTSPAKQLIDTIARQTIENNSDFKAFVSEANKKISEFTDPSNVSALRDIGTELTGILQKYYAQSEMIATWNPIDQLIIQFPTAQIAIKDGGYISSVERVGHGLQRAIIISILEFLANKRMSEATGERFAHPQSDLIIGIEEPEIYQHPTKQRHIARVLSNLAEQFNEVSGIRIQLIYVTHSPLFVQLPRFHEIRIIQRIAGASGISVNQFTLDECSIGLAKLFDPPRSPLSKDSFAAKLHIFTHEVSEGFFANKVILVEGVSDKSILYAVYERNGRSPLAEGIAIIGCEGKKKLDKPLYIFRRLGIPVYVLIDNDRLSIRENDILSEKAYNRLLQKIVELPDAQIIDWPVGVFSRIASFDGNLEEYIKTKATKEKYYAVRDRLKSHFEVEAEDCAKSPTIASTILNELIESGVVFKELDDIIQKVDEL